MLAWFTGREDSLFLVAYMPAIASGALLLGMRGALVAAGLSSAAFMAMCEPGDTILSLPIKSGGHLSHGLKPNFSGTFYKIAEYDLDAATELLDYDAIHRIARDLLSNPVIEDYSIAKQ